MAKCVDCKSFRKFGPGSTKGKCQQRIPFWAIRSGVTDFIINPNECIECETFNPILYNGFVDKFSSSGRCNVCDGKGYIRGGPDAEDDRKCGNCGGEGYDWSMVRE